MPDLHKRLEPLLVPAIVVLVAVSAFGLGRLSVMPSATSRLVINAPQVAAVGASVEVGERKYVASKSGSKYYLPSCSGVKNIKEENKVWFKSITEAEAAGYTPAANCPGL